MDFYFSGIKTAIINLNHKNPDINKADLCASFEYAATTYSVPQPCKRCGSIRTLPAYHILFKSVYKKIWEDMEKIKNK